MTKHLLCICFLCCANFLFSQPLNADAQAAKLIEEAKIMFSENKFSEAAETFENALLRPFNTLTTTAMYLSGVSSYYDHDWVNAQYRLNQLITSYPKSKYIGDAQYHLALAEMNGDNSRTKAMGLERMYALREVMKEIPLAITNEAKQASKIYAFHHLSAEVVTNFYTKAAEKHKTELIEAICYNYLRENNRNEAEAVYQNYLNEGRTNSPFVENLFLNTNLAARQSDGVSSPIVNIAVMLPFFTPNNTVEIDTMDYTPENSQMPLELYEGFMEGIEAYSQFSKKKYFIQVFDTKRDNYTVEKQLKALESLQPDMIIGEIYNKQSRLISEWATQHLVTQIIPLSPTRALIENKRNVFLLNPSTTTHGHKMAEYAYRDLGLRKVTVWTDGRLATANLANAFAARFQVMGGTPIIANIDSVYNLAQPQILQSKDKFTNSEGMYIPINNEETVGLILSLIDANRYKTKVMTLPDVEFYEQIESELKEVCGIYYTTTYTPQIESEGYKSYYENHLLNYNSPPSEYHIVGYDMGQYISRVWDDYNGGDFNQFLRDYVPSYGIHVEYDFNREQDNQGVRIQQYTAEGIITVK